MQGSAGASSTSAGAVQGEGTPKQAFLKKGQGVARFGMKQLRIKPKPKSPAPRPGQSLTPSDEEEEEEANTPMTARDDGSDILPHPRNFSRSLSQSSLTDLERVPAGSHPVRLRKVCRQGGSGHLLYSSTESLPQVRGDYWLCFCLELHVLMCNMDLYDVCHDKNYCASSMYIIMYLQ